MPLYASSALSPVAAKSWDGEGEGADRDGGALAPVGLSDGRWVQAVQAMTNKIPADTSPPRQGSPRTSTPEIDEQVYERLYTVDPRYPQPAVRYGKYRTASTESEHEIAINQRNTVAECRLSDSRAGERRF
jgi:hypothetical protein